MNPPSLDSASAADSLAEFSSDGTTTTSATVPGLGEISGRAILALGNFTLRGAEYVIIRRRLNTIASNFPHQNTCHIQGIEKMYRDILELSRRGLYHDTIRTRALTIILVQVGSRQTQQLIKYLLHWPPIEIKIFITELTTILHPFQLNLVQGAGEQPALIQAYAKSLAPWEGHSLEPFIVFLQRLVEKNNMIGGAILEGGVMDYLLRLYASDFSDPLTIKEPWDFHRRSTLYAACNSLLLIVSSLPRGLFFIRKHQFHILWSVRPELPFTPPAHDRVVQRAQIWASLDKEIILWRIHSMMAMMQDWRRPFEQDLLMDIAIDVLDFSGSESMEPDIYFRALRALCRFLLRGKSSAHEAVCQYMAISNPEYFSEVMSRIIFRTSKLIILDTPEWNIFFSPWPLLRPRDEVSFKSSAVLQIINSLIETAEMNRHFLSVILEANILGLLRPFLQQQLKDPQYSMVQHTGDNLMIYDIADLKLLELISKHGLGGISPDRYNYNNPPFIDMQRKLVSHALNVVFDRKNKAANSVRY